MSIIVPVYNEENSLSSAASHYPALAREAELIFVDGESDDGTADLAERHGRLIRSPKGRARQMNAGAKAARGDILFFLHADTVVTPDALSEIRQAVEENGYVGGCLTQVLDDPSVLYRWIAFTGNLRAKLSREFYGDQGIFVRADIFREIGGFPDVMLGEDVLLTRRLRRYGRTRILPVRIQCSTRRWKQQGIIKSFLLNLRIKMSLKLHGHPGRAAARYADTRS